MVSQKLHGDAIIFLIRLCGKLTDNSLKQLGLGCKNLTFLDFGLSRIASFEGLNSMIESSRKLELLNLGGFHMVTGSHQMKH